MTHNSLWQLGLYLLLMILLVKPLGWYMGRVYQRQSCGLDLIFGPIERGIYKVCGIDPNQEMTWKGYTLAMVLFNLIGLIVVFVIESIQQHLPLNPAGAPAMTFSLALNTAMSFVSNTNWQAYAGETQASVFTQMLAFGVQNFLSAATGMAILVALIRGLTRHETPCIGNFWVDTLRGTFYILIPLSFILAIVLVSQGVIQNFKPYENVNVLQPSSYTQTTTNAKGHTQIQTVPVTQQLLPMGPVASQEAIKQLGTNGGGYFNTNSAHPYENPTPLSNFLEMLALLLIPAALCYTFGMMVKDRRQGWAIFIAMLILYVPLACVTISAEQHANPTWAQMNIQTHASDLSPGGNMEGKEARFGITDTAIWATSTTAASNGSVNGTMDSLMPIGGLISMWLMQLGEVVFGGVGSGLYGMLAVVILTVFIAGLMVGRTPEYLGKKIEPYEMKMACIAVLVMPAITLILTAIGAVTNMGVSSMSNPGAHGFSELLYAFSSMANNNGSAFAGLNVNTNFYNLAGTLAMFVGRYLIAIPMLAIAGSLAQKKTIPAGPGTLPTHTPLFVFLLIGVILILAALTFLPALALGPIVEQLTLLGH